MQEAFMHFIAHAQRLEPIESMRNKQLVVFKIGEISYTKLRFTDDNMSLLFKNDTAIKKKFRLQRLPI